MKIVFFIQHMEQAGGSERVCSLIANFLNDQGNDITILSICGTKPSFFCLNEGIRQETLIEETEVNNRKSFLRVLRALNGFYRRSKVDLVIDVFPALSIYTLLLKKRFGYRNISWEHYNYLNNAGMNKLGRQLAVRYSDLIVTLTETDRQLYIRANPSASGKIISIFNPTPFPDAVPYESRDHSVLAVGRLEAQKGVYHLLSVWARVEKTLYDGTLYIIGDGEERAAIEKRIRELDLKRVRLTGRINNVDRYYEKASVLVSTSEHEGLPMTMIEAQSFGIPIVSFDYMTGPRDIISDGKDGYIVDGTTQDEKNAQMAQRLIYLLSDDEKHAEMSRQAYISSARFGIEEIGKKWLAALEKTMLCPHVSEHWGVGVTP